MAGSILPNAVLFNEILGFFDHQCHWKLSINVLYFMQRIKCETVETSESTTFN